MAACTGNCKYGDALYGNNPEAYDGSRCGCIQCPNFRYCGTWCAPVYLTFNHGCCRGACIRLPRLEFVDKQDKDSCVICLEDKHLFVKHPSGCGHELCLDCFRLCFNPDTEAPPVDPRAYGFDVNCACEFCTAPESLPCSNSLHQWETACPDAYTAWNTAQAANELAHERKLQERPDPAVCFLCRRSYMHRWDKPHVRVLTN